MAGSRPSSGAKHRHYDESHGVFVCPLTNHTNYANN